MDVLDIMRPVKFCLFRYQIQTYTTKNRITFMFTLNPPGWMKTSEEQRMMKDATMLIATVFRSSRVSMGNTFTEWIGIPVTTLMKASSITAPSRLGAGPFISRNIAFAIQAGFVVS